MGFARSAILAALSIAFGVVLAANAGAGCSSDQRDLFVKPFDAGSDAEAGASDAAPEIDPTLGGPCTEDAQCDDGAGCTFDKCDLGLSRCRNTPDDSQCDDGIYCNGKEVCVIRAGCAPGPVVTCEDDDPCTIDSCVEADKSCKHAPRDVDGDQDPDDHCVAHRDCDDTDPTVSSLVAEICGNFKDDNCNGQVDEQPCSVPANDTCGAALAVTAPGTYLLSTVATKKDYATSCSVTNPSAARDIVIAITPPGAASDPPVDVEVWATAEVDANETAVAMQTSCGSAASEIGCGNTPASASARSIARAVVPGTTVYAIVTTQRESAVDVKVDLRPATPKPTNESCAAPADAPIGTPFTVSLIDPAKDLASGCVAATGELTYQFTLVTPQDVKIFASTLAGPGKPVISLRDDDCTDELRCRVGSTPPVFARSLAAGTHVLSVAGTTQLDASVLIQTSPATTPPPNQSCATAPALTPNADLAIDLSEQEDAIPNGCLPGGPAAAYDLELAVASDVLVVGRFPQIDIGAISLNAPGCTTSDVIACQKTNTPARISKRNVPPGSYRVVIADEQGQASQLTVYTRPTVPPTAITGSDGCLDAFVVPAAGGFFTGDTTKAAADFPAGCDAPGGGLGGANDQLLHFNLATPEHVVFDMTGSTYTTILDVRSGATCPGLEVPNACYVGTGPGKSFLDLHLDPATYWLQIDGLNGDRGAWNLDVRVLPP